MKPYVFSGVDLGLTVRMPWAVGYVLSRRELMMQGEGWEVWLRWKEVSMTCQGHMLDLLG